MGVSRAREVADGISAGSRRGRRAAATQTEREGREGRTSEEEKGVFGMNSIALNASPA